MAQINPYVNYNGNAEEAFTFYKSVFGGEFSNLTRFKEMPNAGFEVTENEANKIMHIALPIGHNVLMANDVPEFMYKDNQGNLWLGTPENGAFKFNGNTFERYTPLLSFKP